MTADLLTVMWKDSKSLLRIQGSRLRAILSMVVPVAMIAIFLPIQMREDFLVTAWPLAGAIVLPLLLVGTTIPEAFAGERERHTLPTLLASRLPDRAILFGKWTLGVLYGWLLTLATLLLSAVVVNIVDWTGQVRFYRPDLAVAHIVISLLFAGLIASLGVLVSLRSATVQGAQQTLIFALLLPLMVLQVGPMLLLSLVPNGREILRTVLSVNFTGFWLSTAGILLVMNIAVLALAVRRFDRARLVLN